MTKADNTYQNSKVQLPMGADTLSFDSDGVLNFFGNEITGQQFFNLLYSKTKSQIIINSAGVLSTVNFPADVGCIILSAADAASNASAWLTSGAKEGQELVLMTRGAGSTVSVRVFPSGVTVIGLLSGTLSSISLRGSAASQAMVALKCLDDDVWSVVDFRGSVGLNALA